MSSIEKCWNTRINNQKDFKLIRENFNRFFHVMCVLFRRIDPFWWRKSTHFMEIHFSPWFLMEEVPILNQRMIFQFNCSYFSRSFSLFRQKTQTSFNRIEWSWIFSKWWNTSPTVERVSFMLIRGLVCWMKRLPFKHYSWNGEKPERKNSLRLRDYYLWDVRIHP